MELEETEFDLEWFAGRKSSGGMFVGSICMLRAVMGKSKDGGAPGAERRGPAGK